MKLVSDKLTLAPTDLSHFLSCRHLVSLDLRAAQGEVVRPARYDPLLEDLRVRGLRHETAYLERLRAEALERDDETEAEAPEPPASRNQDDVLAINLDPSPAQVFKKALLPEKRAWIVEVHQPWAVRSALSRRSRSRS